MPKKRKSYPRARSILTKPHPDLVKQRRCGRWRQDGWRTRHGLQTRKREALALFDKRFVDLKLNTRKKTDRERAEVLALEIREKYLEARCLSTVAVAGRACRRHGTEGKRGTENPRYKHGESTMRRILSEADLDLYEAAIKDPLRFAYDPQLAALDVLLKDAIQRKDSPDVEPLLAEAVKEFGRAWGSSKAVDTARHFHEAEKLVKRAQSAEGDSRQARDDALSVLKEKRHTMSQEHMRRHREQLLVSFQEIKAQDAKMLEIMWAVVQLKQAEAQRLDALLEAVLVQAEKFPAIAKLAGAMEALGLKPKQFFASQITGTMVDMGDAMSEESKRWLGSVGLPASGEVM